MIVRTQFCDGEGRWLRRPDHGGGGETGASHQLFGGGGLNFRRIYHGQIKYHRQNKNANPDIPIVDLGTDDLTRERPEVVAGRIRGFDSLQIKPLGIFILPVLPHTRPYVQAALSLVDFNWWVQEFNDLVLAESLRRDHVWVWNHIFLQAGLAFFL